MKSRFRTDRRRPLTEALLGVALLLVPPGVHAGETLSFHPKAALTPVVPEKVSDWQFTLGLPLWVPQAAGYVGVNNQSVHFQLDADKVVQSADMVASFSGEVRKGRFGMYGDFLYMSLSSNERVGGMITQVNLRLDAYLANLELSYRMFEGRWGYVDVRAGCRYMSLYSTAGIIRSDAAIAHGSTELVNNVGKSLHKGMEQALSGGNPDLPLPPLTADQKAKVLALIRIARENPELADAIKSGSKEEVAKIKKRLAGELSKGLQDVLNFNTALFEQWWDPYVGVAARFHLPKSFYVAVKGDYGGFGVGSRETWQASGALGCNLTRNMYAEVGYRYLFQNYRHDGFIWDATTQGFQATVGVRF